MRRSVAAVGTAAVVLAVTAMPAPASATDATVRAAASRYLNLHQCVYDNVYVRDLFTSVVSTAPAAQFNAGTNVSGTRDTTLKCGPGAHGYRLAPSLSGVLSLEVRSGRYLNLHQCAYVRSSGTGDLFTSVVSTTPASGAGTGTNISDTRDTTLKCGPGGSGYGLVPSLSGVLPLEVRSGRYLNLHQCVYFRTRSDLYTNLLPNVPNPVVKAGTNISSVRDTSLKCARGDHPSYSGLLSLDLAGTG